MFAANHETETEKQREIVVKREDTTSGKETGHRHHYQNDRETGAMTDIERGRMTGTTTQKDGQNHISRGSDWR